MRLKALLFPFDNAKIEVWLAQLAEHRFITRYESNGSKYIAVNNFKRHQTPHIKEPASIIPAPDLSETGLGNSQDAVISKRESGIRNQESEGGKSGARFVPPTIDEVRAYCQERGNSVNPEQWIDHYTSNGWKVGRNKMTDWRAAVRTWEKNAFETPAGNAKPVAISGI